MKFCGLSSCLSLYMRVSGSSAGDSSLVNLDEQGSAAMDPSVLEARLFDTSKPLDTSKTPVCPGLANNNQGQGLPSGPTNKTIITGNLAIEVETKEGVSSIESIYKITENGQESVHIIKRLDNGTEIYLQDQNGYEAKLQMKKSEDGSNQYNLIPPSSVLLLELLQRDGCNEEVEQLSEPIEINGKMFEYRVKCNEARYAVAEKQETVCTGSAVVRFEEQNGFVKPQYMLHGSEIEMKQTRNNFVITYSGTFEEGGLSKGEITVKNSQQGKPILTIEGKFVMQDNVPKLNGEGTVDVGPYQITGTFKEGKLVINGKQQAFKNNETQDLGSVMPERTDMKNKLTFRDGDHFVVVTFNPDMGFYTYKIS